MDDLDDYEPWVHDFCGNDLECLNRAKSRLHMALKNPELPARERERCMELLGAESITEYERIRDAWSELVQCLPRRQGV